MRLQNSLTKESQQKLEARIQELKSDLSKVKDQYDEKMRSSDNEKAQLVAKEQAMRETLNELRKDKEKAEKEWKEKAQGEKHEAQRLVEEYKSKMITCEESAKEAQRRMTSSESEFDKQKSLLEQKVEFLESTIESLKTKDKESQAEIKNQKKELMSTMKESNTKYEDKINTLNKKLEDTLDEVAEKESKISELEQKIYVINSNLEEKDLEMKKLKNANIEFEKLKEAYERLEEELEENQKTYNSELQEERDNLKFQVEEMKAMLSQRDSALHNEKAKWEKEDTIKQQKIDFMQTQLEEANHKIEENRRNHEAMMKAVQIRESEKGEAIEEADKKMEELRQSHYAELKEMEERYESNAKRLSDELDKARKSESEIKMKLKLLTSDNDKEITDLRDSLEQAESQRDRALAEIKQIELQKQNLVQQTEERYKSTIQQLEAELDQKDSKNQNELHEQQKRSEEDLAQLKSFYEAEKERLEKRLNEEKIKGQKNVQNCQEEYEQRIHDEQAQHEEEMEMLQDDLREKEDQLQATINHYQHELSLSEQKIQSLEEHLKETKKALDDIQEKNAASFDNQMANFNKERRSLLDKADEVNQSLTEKEKRITALENQNESLLNQNKKKDDELETLKSEFLAQKRHLEDQLETLREEKQRFSDEAMQKNLESGRDKALTQQKIEFQEKKIEELLKALADSSSSYHEKLESQKSELGQEIDAKISKITVEKENILQKFNEKKKAMKDLEKVTLKKITELERERAVNLERIENLDRKLAQEQEYSKKQIEAMREKISILQEEGSKSSESVQQKYFELKDAYNELEKRKNELLSKYEKDEALWKGKNEFLEELKAQLKKDLADSNKKLEASILQLQSKGSSKDQDMKQLDYINHMEREYKDQINTLQENNEKYTRELTDKIKDLEAKNHTLQEKYELSYRDASSYTRNLEKKVNDFEQREKTYLEELSELKAQRDRMILDNQSVLDKERDLLKQKIYDLESKFKNSESEKGKLKFEIEKQQAKWNTEKDHLESTRNEMQETISKLSKKNETLIAMNEKLKEKNKNTKRYNKYGGGGLGGSILDTSTSGRFVTGKFLGVKELEQDVYSSNSGKDNSRFKTFKFIGDGKEGDKKSVMSGDLDKTPDRHAKESESTNTLSPNDDKE